MVIHLLQKLDNHVSDRWRYDRIILQSETIVPIQIEILGNTSIGNEEHSDIFPSDHFGLTGAFENKK